MTDTVLENPPKAEPRERRTRTAFLGERFNDGVEFAKKIGKTGSDAAEELLNDTTLQIHRHPAESIFSAFAAGILLGGFVGWIIGRK
jgi:hypothetical protein